MPRQIWVSYADILIDLRILDLEVGGIYFAAAALAHLVTIRAPFIRKLANFSILRRVDAQLDASHHGVRDAKLRRLVVYSLVEFFFLCIRSNRCIISIALGLPITRGEVDTLAPIACLDGPGLAGIEGFKALRAPMINHQRPTLIVHHLAIAEPRPERADAFFGTGKRHTLGIARRALHTVNVQSVGQLIKPSPILSLTHLRNNRAQFVIAQPLGIKPALTQSLPQFIGGGTEMIGLRFLGITRIASQFLADRVNERIGIESVGIAGTLLALHQQIREIPSRHRSIEHRTD